MKYFILIVLVLLAACNNGSNNADKSSGTVRNHDTTTSNSETAIQCYESINEKDTVYLNLFEQSEIITGSLIYFHYEKDANVGTINGSMHGDTLFAEYVFSSEGLSSIRDVAFLKKGSDFIEGYGDMKQEGEKMAFKNTATLSFTGKPLNKVDCAALGVKK